MCVCIHTIIQFYTHKYLILFDCIGLVAAPKQPSKRCQETGSSDLDDLPQQGLANLRQRLQPVERLKLVQPVQILGVNKLACKSIYIYL